MVAGAAGSVEGRRVLIWRTGAGQGQSQEFLRRSKRYSGWQTATGPGRHCLLLADTTAQMGWHAPDCTSPMPRAHVAAPLSRAPPHLRGHAAYS